MNPGGGAAADGGLRSVEVLAISTSNETSAHVREAALREGFATKGDTITAAAGNPVGVAGTTDMLSILSV